ncbi:hypothetical protein MXB_244 [Myxobolus squamalis]|nr:hypothetical protein MXB_244 [Myxobolus squamalis]
MEFKIKKKRGSKNNLLNPNEEEILFKTCIIAKRDKIIDKSDSSFSIDIKPIPSIIEKIEKKDDSKVDDPMWNNLETTYVECNKGKIKVPDALTIFAAKKKRENLKARSLSTRMSKAAQKAKKA